MSDFLFGFKSKKERNDFLIALVVILFFGCLLYKFAFVSDNVRLNDGEPREMVAETAAVKGIGLQVLADTDEDGIPNIEDNCPDRKGIKLYKGCPGDQDKDGILDDEDKCPNLKGLQKHNGCPEDTDGDGVYDEFDRCPELEGTEELNGCPAGVDTDGDGVEDGMDKCPELAGTADNDGCPADADGDGVADAEDKCPDLAGTAADNGCPADKDKDGVYDKDDKCPGLAGIPANNGCPSDKDGDGIYDKDDKCPGMKGDKANGGCPEIKLEKEERELLEFAVQNVEFKTGSADLTAESQNILDKIHSILEKYPTYKLSISGHTDNQGSAELNKKISKDRAGSCHDYLVNKGIESSRIFYYGFGQEKPIDSNETADGRQKNRRVEFELKY